MYNKKTILPVNEKGFYGNFGGAYIPEILYNNVKNLEIAFAEALDDPSFTRKMEDCRMREMRVSRHAHQIMLCLSIQMIMWIGIMSLPCGV